MYRFPLLLLAALTLTHCTVSEGDVTDRAPADRPNVVFILADDLGIMDINAFARYYVDAEQNNLFYETPHLDRLVARSTAFSQAYATQMCSPTRAGILAGQFAPRLGFMTAMPLRETYYNQNMPVPEGYSAHDVLDHHDDITIEQAWNNATSNSALGPEIVTLPEAMSDHAAAFIGKWHVGGFGAAGVQPSDQGFAPLAYYDAGGSPYYNWRATWNNDSKERFPKMPQPAWLIGDPGPETEAEYLTDDLTAQAINFLEKRATTPEEPFFLYFNHFAVHSPYQGVDSEVERYEEKPSRGWYGHSDPVYASMIQGLDRSVGLIVETLERTGLSENTLIVFMSDNGGIDHKITPAGVGTDNAPFLGGKACLTEGGIRVPLLLHLPGQTNGTWDTTAVDYTDLYPTLLEGTGYDAAAAIEGHDLDGRSFWPLLTESQGTYAKDARYWHYPFNVIYNSPYDGWPLAPHSAVRVGNHKLIFDWHGRLHLYDLVADPYERDDLAQSRPELRDKLFDQLTSWLDANVDRRYWPVRNPEYAAGRESRDSAFADLLHQ